ncbi:hypothetical protein JB92DRAFT_1693270 [Gautieria morchelliformis]|nr:hypothetical protein JB92DRAFT_1693270 [Gautieria morchelliformis]
MKLTFTILTATGLVAAQGYGSGSTSTPAAKATASATPPANIPSNISSGCSNFLSALNSAPGIQSCVSPVLNALPSNSTASISSVCAAVTSNSCPDATVRTWLADFRGNCTAELLTSPNPQVVSLYGVLYVLIPFTNAVCAKDQTGQYCLSQLSSNSTAKAASGVANAAQKPLTSSDGTPDATVFGSANIMWLGANPTMDAASLCTTCTKNVLSSYIQWESSMPPANGLSNLPLLSSQAPLWAAVQQTCPADFISGTLSSAGASPGAANDASASSPAKTAMAMLAVVAAGIMTL